MKSLLGLFYSRIIGSQENIASEGLAYILQQSVSARNAVNKLIKSECNLDFPNITYVIQNVGEKLERPDISGFNEYRKEIITFEAKFWASLTENQPIEYLNRLNENSALIFICPTLRVRSLYDELIRRLQNANMKYVKNDNSHSAIIDINKHLIIKTWNEILGLIRIHLIQDNEQNLLSDIDQIIGLCDTIDSNSFLPLQSSDLSPGNAKRISSYYDLLDKVIAELTKRGIANTYHLKATPQRTGYTRYFTIGQFGSGLELNYNFWGKEADTPFWIYFTETKDKRWIGISDNMKIEIKKIASELNYKIIVDNQGRFYFSLFPLLDRTEDIVINDLTEQILKLKESIETSLIKYYPYSEEDFQNFINQFEWTFAKTYADRAPHEYIVLDKVGSNHKEEFIKIARFIRDNGFKAMYYTREGYYYKIEENYYWTMDEKVEDTNLINRAKWSDYELIDNSWFWKGRK